MSKYDPFTALLTARNLPRIPMQFGELERILGFELPPSARKHRAWWSNNPRNSVMTKAWLAAGYQSEQVDLERERVVFAKLNAVAADKALQRHPLIGCMAGTVTIPDSVDLTAPLFSDAEIDAALDRKTELLRGATG